MGTPTQSPRDGGMLTAESLRSLCGRAPASTRGFVLRSCLEFTETASSAEASIVRVMQVRSTDGFGASVCRRSIILQALVSGMGVQDGLDLDAVRDCELRQVADMDDAAVVLDALRDVKDDMHLGQFDRVDVCRGGLLLVSVVNTSNGCGRSVRVEVFTLRKRLQAALADTNAGGYSLAYWFGRVVVAVAAIGFVYLGVTGGFRAQECLDADGTLWANCRDCRD
jgi:hypothetical protein